MSISDKIIDCVTKSPIPREEQNLMLEILRIEDSDVYRYEAAYEKAIKDYISQVDREAPE